MERANVEARGGIVTHMPGTATWVDYEICACMQVSEPFHVPAYWTWVRRHAVQKLFVTVASNCNSVFWCH
jgi:hypothetical protein